tara:strand:+ start:737 stop:901 length:165 start_codon:yes stop_codon:yes gene_type:complete
MMNKKTVQNGKGSSRRYNENASAISKNWPFGPSALDLRLEAELNVAKANSKPSR